MDELRKSEAIWLGLIVGNSRLHWAWFVDESLVYTWDSDYVSADVVTELAKCQSWQNLPTPLSPPPPPLPPFLISVHLASVVPSQTAIWQSYPDVHIITLEQVPIHGIYPTLGIDRALALFGAGTTWGFPILVIDAGTALTLTGADDQQCLVGGAILPGLGLQLATLAEKTGQLPLVDKGEILSLPPRFAMNTLQAIQSGVIYTLLAGIKDFVEAWWQLFPESKVVITGGDHISLLSYLQSLFPELTARLIVERNLIFLGMRKNRDYSKNISNMI